MRKNMCICDICGNVFAPNEEIKKDNPFNKDTSRIFLKGKSCGLNDDKDYCDVCPACTEKISHYIDTELKRNKKWFLKQVASNYRRYFLYSLYADGNV